ncbi:MAG: hypothetical protein WC222_05715 [Parachlamydiales bacterium]|jgi:hypothetical protein
MNPINQQETSSQRAAVFIPSETVNATRSTSSSLGKRKATNELVSNVTRKGDLPEGLIFNIGNKRYNVLFQYSDHSFDVVCDICGSRRNKGPNYLQYIYVVLEESEHLIRRFDTKCIQAHLNKEQHAKLVQMFRQYTKNHLDLWVHAEILHKNDKSSVGNKRLMTIWNNIMYLNPLRSLKELALDIRNLASAQLLALAHQKGAVNTIETLFYLRTRFRKTMTASLHAELVFINHKILNFFLDSEKTNPTTDISKRYYLKEIEKIASQNLSITTHDIWSDKLGIIELVQDDSLDNLYATSEIHSPPMQNFVEESAQASPIKPSPRPEKRTKTSPSLSPAPIAINDPLTSTSQALDITKPVCSDSSQEIPNVFSQFSQMPLPIQPAVDLYRPGYFLPLPQPSIYAMMPSNTIPSFILPAPLTTPIAPLAYNPCQAFSSSNTYTPLFSAGSLVSQTSMEYDFTTEIPFEREDSPPAAAYPSYIFRTSAASPSPDEDQDALQILSRLKDI